MNDLFGLGLKTKEGVFNTFLHFLKEHALSLQHKTLEHIALVGVALCIASILAIPLGIIITRFSHLRSLVLNLGSISQTIPSLALLALLVPFVGLGNTPTLIVLVSYALYPLLRSTYTGLKNVPAECIEAAKGLGFSNFQRLWWVEIPLSFPSIISGLRIATAMTIGITTMAAFIGAGGLGDFITQGLSLNDPSLILLGTIPTALLALSFDYGISQFEVQLHSRKKRSLKLSRVKKICLGFLSIILIFLGVRTFLNEYFIDKKKSVIIGSKNFTEQYILAELMAQTIEAKTPLKVIRRFNLGTTAIVHQALLKGDVDLYPEYSGTAYITILKGPLNIDKEGVFKKVRSAYKEKFKVRWLDPFGFSNSQSLALKRDFAEAHQIESLSDLSYLAKNLRIAAPPEFLKRQDAFPRLSKTYGLRFKEIIQVDPNLMYTFIENQKVQVIAAFTTDGKLQKYDLITLKDDKEAYPPYQAAPVIRESVLLFHPEIQEALGPLLGHITGETIKALNYKVEGEGLSPFEAVRQFLQD